MLKEKIIKASSEDEAIKQAVKELELNEEYLFAEEEKKGTYKVFANVSLKLEAKKYLENLFKNIGLEMKMEIRTVSENNLVFNLDTDENALVIGKDGKNLNAIKHMLRLLLSQFTSDKLIINVDVANYTATKVSYLERLAIKLAREVQKSKTDVKLDPMNSFERRVIHDKLSSFKNIKTESEGFGKNRAIVLKYCPK